MLIGTALAFALLGMATGDVPLPLLTALPLRLVGLLENDLLQALPLYVLMGALLNRLPLAGQGVPHRQPRPPGLHPRRPGPRRHPALARCSRP